MTLAKHIIQRATASIKCASNGRSGVAARSFSSSPRLQAESKGAADTSDASYGNHSIKDTHTDSVTQKADEENITKSSSKHKTQAQRDQELMDKMAGLSGDGGASGVETEGGKPKGMGRAVKDNMFRYI